MARTFILTILVLSAWATGTATVSAAAHRVPVKSSVHQTTTYGHTQALVRSFIHAYNKHDLRAVLSLFIQNVKYADCDWAKNQLRFAAGKSELKHLFQREFADSQEFLQLAVITANPHQRYVAEAQFVQTSRSMRRHGMAPQATNFKVVLQDPGFDHIDHIAGGCMH